MLEYRLPFRDHDSQTRESDHRTLHNGFKPLQRRYAGLGFRHELTRSGLGSPESRAPLPESGFSPVRPLPELVPRPAGIARARGAAPPRSGPAPRPDAARDPPGRLGRLAGRPRLRRVCADLDATRAAGRRAPRGAARPRSLRNGFRCSVLQRRPGLRASDAQTQRRSFKPGIARDLCFHPTCHFSGASSAPVLIMKLYAYLL
jgi:hypothetical protein